MLVLPRGKCACIIISASLCLLVAFGAGGCATIVTRSFQTITVQTEPEGADCTFSRDGIPLVRVDPTPGGALVGKSAGALSLLCRKEGYLDAATPMESGFQAMTLGNVLIGGVFQAQSSTPPPAR